MVPIRSSFCLRPDIPQYIRVLNNIQTNGSVDSWNRKDNYDQNLSCFLVVDDEQCILDLMAENLSDDGFAVISATNGASALVLIYRGRPDIGLLDLMIPIVNGY